MELHLCVETLLCSLGSIALCIENLSHLSQEVVSLVGFLDQLEAFLSQVKAVDDVVKSQPGLAIS